ncbi:LysR family transcriptional regulator [Egbenema bharatensis]|uniref:LysR family transcriptional regulator n=1 Tax=Egbenema bharatensis TaxID=3463334 RepID=UPI003A8A4453
MKTEDITLNHIKILKTVNDCGSFSQAAKQLQCSQAMISKKVKQLEECFGVRLLTRSPGAIGLTYKGKKLIANVQNTVETVERLQEEFQLTLSAEGEDLFLGVSPLSEVWLEQNLYRFQLCFPGREMRKILVESGRLFTDLQALKFDALLNHSPAYKEKHHCTRLQTYPTLLVSFDPEKRLTQEDMVRLCEIEFSNVVLLEEVYQELSRYQYLDKNQLNEAKVVNNYQQLLELAHDTQKLTILPDFCQTPILGKYQTSSFGLLQDAIEYGVYIHVPHFGELLVSAESLVRSFRLDQVNLENRFQLHLLENSQLVKESNIVRIGIQRDSLGQLVASYGTKYIFDLLKQEPTKHIPLDESSLRNIKIDRGFELQVIPFPSGEQINHQMKRGELDLCVLDDVSLLNNGFQFFKDFSFGSKLIGIASYNLFGQDLSIVLPKDSSIVSVHQLQGKRISTWFGSNAHRFVITLFELYGMDVNQDCKLIDEDPRTGSTSLLNGQIDAYVCCKTFAATLINYLSLRALTQEQMLSIKIPSLRGIVCRSQFIKENPKFVIAYLHDLVITNHWFTSNPSKAIDTLSALIGINKAQLTQFFSSEFGSRIDPTLKPQWSWLLKTLNRRLDGKYNTSLFDVDFWIEDYFLRLVYNLLDLDYHFQQVSFANELSNSYFLEEKFNRYTEVIHNRSFPVQ